MKKPLLALLLAACSDTSSTAMDASGVDDPDAATAADAALAADAAELPEPDAAPAQSCTADWCVVEDAPSYAWDLSVTPAGDPWIVSYGAYSRTASGWRHHDVSWDDVFDPFVVHNELYVVHALSASDVWVGGRQGYLGHWNGSSFTEHRPAAPWPRGIWGAAADDVWVLYDSGLRYHFDGVELSAAPTSEVRHFGAWGSSASDVWGYGEAPTGEGNALGPALDHYDGTSWETIRLPGYGRVTSFWKSGDDDLWAISWVNGESTVHRGDGDSWTTVESMSGIGMSAVWGRSASDVWLVGQDGKIFHYDGASFSASASGTTEDLTAIRGTDSTIWIVGSGVALEES